MATGCNCLIVLEGFFSRPSCAILAFKFSQAPLAKEVLAAIRSTHIDSIVVFIHIPRPTGWEII